MCATDPVGVAECYVLALCLVRQFMDARSAKCRQVILEKSCK